jgi:hypothetical protein
MPKLLYLKLQETGTTMPYDEISASTLTGTTQNMGSVGALIDDARTPDSSDWDLIPFIEIDDIASFAYNTGHDFRFIMQVTEYFATDRTLFCQWKESTDDRSFKVVLNTDGNIEVHISNFGTDTDALILFDYDFVDGLWHNVYVQRDFEVGPGYVWHLYVDGVVVDTVYNNTNMYDPPSYTNFTFFNDGDRTTRAWYVEIDQFELWNNDTQSPEKISLSQYSGNTLSLTDRVPAALQTEVALDSNIQVTIADAISAIQLNTVDIWVEGTQAYEGSSDSFINSFTGTRGGDTSAYTFDINPPADFSYGQTVDVRVYAENDGADVLDETYNFTAEVEVFPYLRGQDPAPASTGILIGDNVEFIVDGGSGTVTQSTIVVTIDGTIAYSGSSFQNSFTGTATDIGGGDFSFDVNPPADFAYGTSIPIRVEADNSLARSLDDTYNFTTETEVLPYLSGRDPAVAATVQVNTDVALTINGGSGNIVQNTIVVTINGVVAYQSSAFQNSYTGTVTPSGGDFAFNFDTPANLPFSSSIPVVVTADNTLARTLNDSYNFNTFAEVLPSLSNQDPFDTETGVSVGTNVQFRLDGGSDFINQSTIVVTIGGTIAYQTSAFQNSFTGTVTPVGNALDFDIDPPTDLYPLTSISVRVEATNLLARVLDQTYNFTTETNHVHLWPWVEPGANLYNDTVGAANGTLTGTEPQVQGGGDIRYVLHGNAGNADTIVNFGEPAGTNFGSDDFMIECRIKQHNFDQSALVYPILWEREDPTDGPNVYFRTDYLQRWHFLIRFGGSLNQSTWDNQSAPDWTHLVFRKRGTLMALFRDGVKQGAEGAAPATVPDLTGIEANALGSFLKYFDVDYIAIWRGSLDDAGVASHYAALDDMVVAFTNDREGFPVGGPLLFNISSTVGNIVGSSINLTFGGTLAYDGSTWQAGFTSSTITADGSGGFNVSLVPDNAIYESFPFILNVQAEDDAGSEIDRIFNTATQRVLAVHNSGFEAETSGNALYWTHEGVSPMGDVGTGSAIIDPLPWWTPPEGSKVDITTTKDSASLLGQVETRTERVSVAYPTSGLVAHFAMDDDAASTTVIESVAANNGTLTGGPNTQDISVLGKIDTALQLTGSPNYIRVANQPAFAPANITVGAWVKIDVHVANSPVICHPYDNAGWVAPYYASWRLNIDASGTRIPAWLISTGTAYTQITATTALDPGIWYHLAGTYDGTTMRIYVNGIEENSTVPTVGGPILYDASNPDLSIGTRSPYSLGEYLRSRVDELRIYNRALDADELSALALYYRGALPKISWAANIVAGSLGVDVDSVPYAQDDGKGSIDKLNPTLLEAGETFHYKLNDNAATPAVIDAAGNYPTAITAGGPNSSDLTIAGKVSTAFNFAGAGDQFRPDGALPAFGTLDPWTIAFWLFPRSTQVEDFGLIARMGDPASINTSNRIYWYRLGDALGYQTENGFRQITQVNADVWNHVVIVSAADGADKIQYYVNGSLVWTDNGWAQTIDAFRWTFGSDGTNHLDGIIDDMRFYQYALSYATITKIYNNNQGTEESFNKYSVGSTNYFTGGYEVTVPVGTIDADYSNRVPSYHRARRSAQLLDPRLFNFLSWYRKFEVPAAPALPTNLVVDAEVELDDQVIWSATLQSGDEGSSIDGRVVELIGALSSDPRIKDRIRLGTGADDTQSFDNTRNLLENFDKWGPVQAEPINSDEKLAFDNGANEVEEFEYWAAPVQDPATTVVLTDSMDDWSAYIEGPASVPAPSKTAGFTYSDIIGAAGATNTFKELQSGLIEKGYIWVTHFLSGEPFIEIMGAKWGNIIMGESFAGSSGTTWGTWIYDGTGLGSNHFGYGADNLPGLIVPFFGSTSDLYTQVIGFVAYGSSDSFELWTFNTLGYIDRLYETSHLLWTAREPLTVHVISGVDPQSGLTYAGKAFPLSEPLQYGGNVISIYGINNSGSAKEARWSD